MKHSFPNDENGKILQSLIRQGDPLTEAREVNFTFVFSARSQAIGFIQVLNDKQLRLELSWYAECELWDVTVVQQMVPEHQEITDFEGFLIEKAQPLDGKPDGWGCFALKP